MQSSKDIHSQNDAGEKKKGAPQDAIGETGVGWDTFHFFSNIAETIYDEDL